MNVTLLLFIILPGNAKYPCVGHRQQDLRLEPFVGWYHWVLPCYLFHCILQMILLLIQTVGFWLSIELLTPTLWYGVGTLLLSWKTKVFTRSHSVVPIRIHKQSLCLMYDLFYFPCQRPEISSIGWWCFRCLFVAVTLMTRFFDTHSMPAPGSWKIMR